MAKELRPFHSKGRRGLHTRVGTCQSGEENAQYADVRECASLGNEVCTFPRLTLAFVQLAVIKYLVELVSALLYDEDMKISRQKKKKKKKRERGRKKREGERKQSIFLLETKRCFPIHTSC